MSARRQGTRFREKGLSSSTNGQVAILSPHLDDAALSLGGSIVRATRTGTDVRIVTVFAYDPTRVGPPKSWDAACGFASVQEAARVRRDEDARACQVLGATPVWLPFGDVEYDERRNDEDVWTAIAEAVAPVDLVLIPGFPLAAPDHLWLTRLLLRRPLPSVRLGFYVEQPYAAWRLIGRGRRAGAEELSPWFGVVNFFRIALRTPGARRLQQPHLPKGFAELVRSAPRWTAASTRLPERRAKWSGIRHYRSQVRAFGPLVLPRVAMYEAAWGGEGVACVSRVDGNQDKGHHEESNSTSRVANRKAT